MTLGFYLLIKQKTLRNLLSVVCIVLIEIQCAFFCFVYDDVIPSNFLFKKKKFK